MLTHHTDAHLGRILVIVWQEGWSHHLRTPLLQSAAPSKMPRGHLRAAPPGALDKALTEQQPRGRLPRFTVL